MPTLVHALPKYRKHKASGQAVVRVRGKDKYLGPYGSKASKEEYDRTILEWLATGRRPIKQPDEDSITVKEVLARFAIHAKRYYRKKGEPTGTAENFNPAIILVSDLYGPLPAVKFGPLALKAVMVRMVELGNSRRYVNDNMHRIKRMFRWAASEEIIPAEIVQALETVDALAKDRTDARESEPIEPVSDATVELTLPHLPEVVADMVRLQRLTGMRPGEICQLRPTDIERSGDVWTYTPGSHKTEHHNKRRIVFLGPKAQAVLGPYLLRGADLFCFSPAESEKKRLAAINQNRKTPLSSGNSPGTNRTGARVKRLSTKYTNDSYRQAVTRGCELAFGMPKELRYIPKALEPDVRDRLLKEAAEWRAIHCWSPNQLRHSVGTEVRQRFGLEAAQCVLGHSRADVTQIYALKNLELAAKIAKECG